MFRMPLTLATVAHFTDNGDGSSSATFYNNREELVADLEASGADYSLEDIESGHDSYKTGTLSRVEIELEYDEDTGEIRLVNPFTLSSD